ncbi:MAG: hypothetical protein IPN70_01775 [Candidatus Moraniibacteriota bacterium]|nr:MAG: hypothetical protein IPN70_01775 [Candidatus Moranbacteria bacterium]
MQNYEKKNYKEVIKKVFFLGIALSFFSFAEYTFAKDPEDVEKDIKEVKEEIKEQLEKKETLEKSHGTIIKELNSTVGEIKEVQGELKKTKTVLERKVEEIESLKKRLILQRAILSGIIQNLYRTSQTSLASVLSQDGMFAQATQIEDAHVMLQARMSEMMKDIEITKTQIAEEKKVLEVIKQEKEEVLDEKQDEAQDLTSEKVTHEKKIAQTEATIEDLKKEMAKLQSSLNQILGKAYDTGQIKDAIKFAAKATGVREGFLFGVMSMESGGNPLAGRCTYSNASMNETRKKYFKEICEELNADYKKRPVSCASKSYPGSGGAMGVAQFMPDTWAGYKAKIASNTGHNPPDPWSLLDGTVAMALKLANDGATKSGEVSIKNPCNKKSVNVKWEVYASMRYLGWTCYGYTNYAPGIQNLAKQYKNM